MAVYHTVMEAYNITTKNASDQLQKKLKMHEGKHSERCAASNNLFVPENPRKKCTGFSYFGPKLYNMVPKYIIHSSLLSVFGLNATSTYDSYLPLIFGRFALI